MSSLAVVGTVAFGAVFGAVWAMVGYALTRGQRITAETLAQFIGALEIPATDKARLAAMRPADYTGNAEAQARRIRSAIAEDC